MRRHRKTEGFNLSFLDIMACGLGAVVLVLMLVKHNVGYSALETDLLGEDLASLQQQEQVLQAMLAELKNISQSETEKIALLKEKISKLEAELREKNQRLGQKDTETRKLDDDLEGLSLVQDSLKQISIAPSSSSATRDDEVGGIPVDTDYVIFVVDTSGSMLNIWSRVSATILNVLSIHPKVKGFQIVNDQGKALISAYESRWIPDTAQRRKSVMKVFSAWNDLSNSSPVEGINTALRVYAKPGQEIAIYVFGDDYTGSSYDPVIEKITKLNKGGIKGKRLAKIHAVGFISPNTSNRFAILMRELTKRNGGTFLALPL